MTAILGEQATASVTMPAADFVASFKKPLMPPMIQSPPRLRITWAVRARSDGVDDSELVPNRSARLAAKSKNRLHQPEAQARKVMMKRVGVEVETQLPDEASF